MSLPHTLYESNLAHGEMRRERSLQMHEHLQHLPQGESLLQRLVRRLRTPTSGAIEASPRPSLPKNIDTRRPAAFSK
jgi:hypothetical protein